MRIHKLILLAVLLVKPAQAQDLSTNSTAYTEALGGATITLDIRISEPVDVIQVYRKTGVTTTPMLIASLSTRPNVFLYTLSYRIPTGTPGTVYRFFFVTKKGNEFLDESNGVRVRRVR